MIRKINNNLKIQRKRRYCNIRIIEIVGTSLRQCGESNVKISYLPITPGRVANAGIRLILSNRAVQ
jgi:hypothetical protein